MALTIVRGPQVPIGVRIGYAKAPTAKMVVMSLTNGAASVLCNSVTYPVTWTATDTETPPAGYVGTITITGLSEFAPYSYTVTQGANSVSGAFRTLPSSQDSFYFWAISCDASALTGFNNTGHGFYKNMREHVDPNGLHCVGILHVDDHGYNSSRKVTDSIYPGMGTFPPSTLQTDFAYAGAWLNHYGLHADGSGVSGLGESTAATANTDIGRNPDRVWCMQNLPVWPQWGDWEFDNDLGIERPVPNPTYQSGIYTLDSYPNGYHKTFVGSVGQRDGAGLRTWQKFMSPLQPPSISNLDTNANHWAFNLGCIQVLAVDGITNCAGSVLELSGDISTNDANVTQIPAMFGMNQIADINAARDPNAPFTFLGLMNSVRYMGHSASAWNTGAQAPLKNHCPAEFAALFTAPGSLTDSRNTVFTINGDLHNAHIYHHVVDGADFYEVGVGTCNGSTNHKVDSTFGVPPVGQAFKGSVIEYLDYVCGQLNGPGPTGASNYWGVKVSVFGSKAVKELLIELMDANSAVLWSAKFLSRNGTTKFADDYVVPTIVGTVHV